MKISFAFSYLFLVSVVAMFTGCANLDKINNFAVSAEKGAADFETLPVTFKSICADDCKEQDIKAGRLNSSRCDCGIERQADSVDYLFYKTIDGYLNGLQKLSVNQTVSYSSDSSSAKSTNQKESSAPAAAYSKLAKILAKAITDGYRRNKLKIYIAEANPPLQILVQYLRSNIGTSLAIRLNTTKSKLENDYLGLLKNCSGDDFEKRRIIEEFYVRNTSYQNQLGELKAYAGLLQTIAEGHQQLTNNLDKDGLKEMLTRYASNINDIHTQIQLFKK